MADKLHLSRSLSLPTDYVTSTGGVLAVRGAGKTNASRLMVSRRSWKLLMCFSSHRR